VSGAALDESRRVTLAVIIVNYNSCDDLARCLGSLREHPPACPHAIVVVDNASREPGLADVRVAHPGVRWLLNTENAGYSRGVNRGLEEVDADWALVLNPDIQVLPGAIDALLAFAAAHPRAGIVGPQLLNEDGTIQRSARRFYTFRTLLMRRTPLGRLFPDSRSVRDHLMLDFDFRSERAVDWVLGGAMLVRREARLQTGPLDERFFLYFEDVDWCFRMWQAGWEVLYAPAAGMLHKHRRASAGGAFRRAFWLHMGSLISFYEKWGLLLYLFKRWRTPLAVASLWLLDMLALNTALLLAYGLRVLLNPLFPERLFPLADYGPLFVYATLLATVTFPLRGRYQRTAARQVASPLAAAQMVGLLALLLFATTFLSHQRLYSRPVLLLFVPIFWLLLGGVGMVFGALRRRLDRDGPERERTLLVGPGEAWSEWLAGRGELGRDGIDPVGFADDASTGGGASGASGALRRLGGRDEIVAVVTRCRIAQVVFWDSPRPGREEDELLDALRRAGLRLRWRLDDAGLLAGARPESFAGGGSLVLEPARTGGFGRAGAQLADRGCGLALVVFGALPYLALRAGAFRDSGRATYAWRGHALPGGPRLRLVAGPGGRPRPLAWQAPFGWDLLTGRAAVFADDGGGERAAALWNDLASVPEAFERVE
jgi:GT2 family glycosyltransferase